jgi:hypothetical protein
MIAGARGGGGGAAGRTVSIQQTLTFVGSLSDSEKQWFRAEARQQTIDALYEVLPGGSS